MPEVCNPSCNGRFTNTSSRQIRSGQRVHAEEQQLSLEVSWIHLEHLTEVWDGLCGGNVGPSIHVCIYTRDHRKGA
jgi:hypothetical protein